MPFFGKSYCDDCIAVVSVRFLCKFYVLYIRDAEMSLACEKLPVSKINFFINFARSMRLFAKYRAEQPVLLRFSVFWRILFQT